MMDHEKPEEEWTRQQTNGDDDDCDDDDCDDDDGDDNRDYKIKTNVTMENITMIHSRCRCCIRVHQGGG